MADAKTRREDDDQHVDYHHFTLTFDKRQVGTKFNDVRFVLIAGCARRAEAQAKYLESSDKFNVELLTTDSSRFVLFKAGPALVANHGMGAASMSIAVHELMLMCRVARVLDRVTLIRFGTCGGVGVAPGTLCVTRRALDPMLQDYVELKICSRLVRRQCVMDEQTGALLEQLGQQVASESGHKFQARGGATVATNDFYEEQGRTTGAICDHSAEDARAFLEKLRDAGVINLEMESNYLAAMCHKLGVSFGVICVALTDRLAGGKIEVSSADVAEYVERLFRLNSLLIRHKLADRVE